MIPWWTALLAFGFGLFWGIAIISCLAVAKRADEDMETYMHNLETGQWHKQ